MYNMKIYLDDVRTPIDKDWTIVRNYRQFIDLIDHCIYEDIVIDTISFDHDLGEEHMLDYYTNQYNGIDKIEYESFTEPTGLDCAKYLINKLINGYEYICPLHLYVHSANPVGSKNILLTLIDYRDNYTNQIEEIKFYQEPHIIDLNQFK